MKHIAVWQCDRAPTTRIKWRDDEDRKCFAHFCDTHALDAEERRKKGKQAATLEDLIK